MSDPEDKKPALPPAVQHAIAMPPALVEAVQDDPELLTQLTRGQLAVVQDRMVQRVLGDADATIGQLAAVHDALSKNAHTKKAEGSGPGPGAQVVINFIRHSGKEKVVVEGQARELPEPDAA